MTQALTIPANDNASGFGTFDATASGGTAVRASAPGFARATLDEVFVTVETPTILYNNNVNRTYTVGRRLGTPLNTVYVWLQTPAPAGGVDITLATAAPAIALVAPVNETIGSGSVVLPVSGGQQRADFRIIGADLGDTIVTANAPGYLTFQTDIAVQPAGLSIQGLLGSYSAGSTDTTVSLRSYYLNDAGAIQSIQPVMADTSVEFSSSQPGFGTISTPVLIASNTDTSANAVFVAVSEGITLVSATAIGETEPGRFQAVVNMPPSPRPYIFRILP
jgi:hypothetical protein